MAEPAARQRAVEAAIQSVLTRRFGNYEFNGEQGVIRSFVPVAINFRELATAARSALDEVDGRSPEAGQ